MLGTIAVAAKTLDTNRTRTVEGALCRVMEDDNAQLGVPCAQLALPVAQRGDGGQDEGGLEEATAREAPKKSHELHRLAKAHLVTHDTCKQYAGSHEQAALGVKQQEHAQSGRTASALQMQLPQPLHAHLLVGKKPVVRARGHLEAAVEADKCLSRFAIIDP